MKLHILAKFRRENLRMDPSFHLLIKISDILKRVVISKKGY